MADIKITDLAGYTNPVSTDVLPIVDVGNDLTKKVSIADLLENAGAGSASAPSFSFDGDNDTGIYRAAVNKLGFATGGSGRLFLDADGDATFSGNVGINNAPGAGVALQLKGASDNDATILKVFGPAGATGRGLSVGLEAKSTTDNAVVKYDAIHSNGEHSFLTGGASRVRIDRFGRVGIGTTDPYSPLTVRGTGQQITLDLNTTTNGSHSDIVWNGAASDLGADPTCEIRGIRSDSGAHGTLAFHTRGAGNTSVERMRVASTGNIGIGTSSPTEKLEVAGSAIFTGSVSIGGTDAANTIDEYEEGTFTPTLNWTNVTYTTQTGKYTKIGNVVYYTIRITWTANDASASTIINGLPFSSDADIEKAVVVIKDKSLPADFQYPYVDTFTNQLYVRYVNTSGNADVTYPVSANDAGTIEVTGHYFVS